MHNARFRLMAGLAGATLCVFAATSYGQNTSTQAGTTNGTATTPDAGAQSTPSTSSPSASAPATTPDASAQAPATTGTVTTGTTATDATTTTTTSTGFPGGTLGILAVAVLVLLILFALFRGRDRDSTVVRESSVSSSAAAPGARTTAGTAGGERMNLDSRAASGTSTTTGSSVGDPNTRR
jgi:hypothetical protein